MRKSKGEQDIRIAFLQRTSLREPIHRLWCKKTPKIGKRRPVESGEQNEDCNRGAAKRERGEQTSRSCHRILIGQASKVWNGIHMVGTWCSRCGRIVAGPEGTDMRMDKHLRNYCSNLDRPRITSVTSRFFYLVYSWNVASHDRRKNRILKQRAHLDWGKITLFI